MLDEYRAIDKYADHIYKYLLCLTHDLDLSEELTQETIYRAIKNINQLKNEEKIEMWLCKIAKNLWLQEINKNKKYTTFDENVLKQNIINEDIEEELIYKENKIQVYKIIDKLDSIDKEVILLRITEELKFKEIGEIFGKTENWARVTFYRAKQYIMKEVKKNDKKSGM